MGHKIAVLYTTISTIEAAQELAHLALSHKAAACVNIIPQGQSIYLWNGKIQQENECYLIFKTTIERIDFLKELIVENHPYDIPAILTFDSSVFEKFFYYLSESMQLQK